MSRQHQVRDEGYYPLEEVLLDQEIVYQSIRNSIPSSIDSISKGRPGSNDNSKRGDGREEAADGDFSPPRNLESQLEEDEALARALQASLTEISSNVEAESSSGSSSTPFGAINSLNLTNEVTRQDDIDPESMTYEELQSLGESIGTESRGLSDELIGYLPSSKYKIGLFSKKEKRDQSCVICCLEYKNRDKLITLPCKHFYHSICVAKWLKLNRACPVCQVEVFG